MKIGIVCYPTYGGSGVVATELGKALARKGYDTHFISHSRPARLEHFSERLHYHEVSLLNYPLFEFPPYELALTSKMVDVVKFAKLDLLHVHYAIPHAYAAYMAKKILEAENIQIPIVTTLHGTDITLVGRDASYEPAIAFCINESDAVTAVSSYLREETKRYFSITQEIEVIPNFIDLERFKNLPKVHFKTAIAPEHEMIVVHTSNFRKVKRVEDVVKIFSRIRESKPAKLLLIGDGPERNNVEKLCRQMPYCSDVRFLGKIDAVEEVLAVSDLFVLPSELESFGLAALEAMACGVPVISSNTGGLSEVNKQGYSGYTSDVGNVEEMAENALKILESEETHKKFRKNAQKQAAKYDIQKVLPIYENMYQKTAESLKQ